jgi:hypothetical protein
MNNATRVDGRGLNQGGPGDQRGPRPDPQDDGQQGSQSGRPQNQGPAMPDKPGAQRPRAPLPQDSTAEDERGVSDTERQAGTPDPRATTDWIHGENEQGPGGR